MALGGWVLDINGSSLSILCFPFSSPPNSPVLIPTFINPSASAAHAFTLVSGPETPRDDGTLDFVTVLRGVEGLAARHPGLTIVVNHCGGAIGPRTMCDPSLFEEWKSCVQSLAERPNCMMKLGGLHMSVNGFKLGKDVRPNAPIGSDELADMMLPLYKFLIEAFGCSRCMFESNFPMDKECISYTVLWNSFKRVCRLLRLTQVEKALLFSETAIRCYKLELYFFFAL